MGHNILIQIQNNYISFSEKEKMIADYIIAYSSTLNNININDLAQKTGTSNSTITRFCKKIGCKNFVEMKMQLCADNNHNKNDKSYDLFEKIYSYYKTIISGNNKILHKETITKFIEKIKKSEKIFIYGLGSSALTAIEIKYRFQRMGMLVDSITDSHVMLMNSSLVTEKDLVIGISNSGATNEVIEGLKLAQKRNAYTVAITSFKESAITRYADLCFITYNTKFIEEKNFINSQLSIIYLVDILSMILLEDEELCKSMEKTLDVIYKYKEASR